MARVRIGLSLILALALVACGNKDKPKPGGGGSTGGSGTDTQSSGNAPGVRTIAKVTPKNQDPAGPLNGFVRVAQGEYDLVVSPEGDQFQPSVKVDLEFLKEGEEPPGYALVASLRLNLVDSAGNPIRAGQGAFVDEMDLVICDHEREAWEAALKGGKATVSLRFCSPQTYAAGDDSYAQRARDVKEIWVSTAPQKPAIEKDL